jgi:hypothetical protein
MFVFLHLLLFNSALFPQLAVILSIQIMDVNHSIWGCLYFPFFVR